ncbi:MAG: STAS domain-containing protein, partial [Bacteroidota bacterium]
ACRWFIRPFRRTKVFLPQTTSLRSFFVTIIERVDGDVTVLGFQGTLMGEPEASMFQQKKFQLLEAKRNMIVIDLYELKMINSYGLGTLISALVSARNRGGDIFLARVSKDIDYVIKTVQLGKVFKIFETVEEAVASFRS